MIDYDKIIAPDTSAILFNLITGLPQRSKKRFKDITEPGVDGIALMYMGKKAEFFTLHLETNAADIAAADTVLADLAALLGQPCTIYKLGRSYPNFTPTELREGPIRKALAVDGGVVPGGLYLISGDMDFVYTGTP